ncbi:uncharacterized protein TM35_000015790 [Trypanosoma theileri]|uniref:Cilia- and flagella-associated protein 418 n=1 Tax=Trypanosoma theileri TaxID=67003 RepID=A0A1X0P9U1_9TRYP|nr:uncharacterized protein TM35_000015790 [Trypanosoma theileri]ORC93702.1 hypothetical protein TM35_000015790 [Trypanosoma theileri]
MSDVDQLIDELFPTGKKGLGMDAKKTRELEKVRPSHSDWDSSDDEAIEKGTKGRATQFPVSVSKNTDSVSKISSKNYFDDSDDNNSEGSVVKSGFTVPFPLFPNNIGRECKGRCLVTNMGAKNIFHPSISQLLLVAEGKYNARSTQKQLFERKGAFHAYNPEVGNGASDRYSHDDNSGGCPFIMCCKCNYAVIRLQGAAWQDRNGTIDLYLTVRNYYPDWSRLASSYPVGQKTNGVQNRVLCASSNSAAYCCQCSWLSVKSPREMIETLLVHHAGFVGREDSCCFATQLPLLQGEKRRPPLWVCRGHLPQF